MGGREGVWYASKVLSWDQLGAECVGGFGGVLWTKILGSFAWEDGGWVVVPFLFGFVENSVGVCWVVRCVGLVGRSKLSVLRGISRVRVCHLVVCGGPQVHVVWA